MTAGDPRGTQEWFRVRDQTVAEEPVCWLQLEGCTGASQTADHVLTVRDRPDLALVRSNLRGVCHSCNRRRGRLGVNELRRGGAAPALGFFG